MIAWITAHEVFISLCSTISLVIVTIIYVYVTKKILDYTIKLSNLTYNPVIGIRIKKIEISDVYGPSRRSLSVCLELLNVGNAPAIEVLIDSEITFRYTTVSGKRTIPSRFEPDMVPFIRPNEELKEDNQINPCFGNTCITHLFDDFREANRLNLHRIETDPTSEPFNASSLKVVVYYRNNLEQYFESSYETNLYLESEIPKDNETAELIQIYIPRPKFLAFPINKEKMDKEILERNSKRELCGW